MNIIVGKVVGAEFREGTSKEGKAYKIMNVSVAVAEKSLFDGMPSRVSIPADKIDSVRSRLLGGKVGDPFLAMVDIQTRSNGPDQLAFVDWFQFPNSAPATPGK